MAETEGTYNYDKSPPANSTLPTIQELTMGERLVSKDWRLNQPT